MHSLQDQNAFLLSCGLKNKIIQNCSINRSCEDVRLETISPEGRFFFSLLLNAEVLDCCSGS